MLNIMRVSAHADKNQYQRFYNSLMSSMPEENKKTLDSVEDLESVGIIKEK